MTTTMTKMMLSNNGFKAYKEYEDGEQLDILIHTPFDDIEDNDSSRGEYLTFKLKVQQLDICRRARANNKRVIIKYKFIPE
jgi:hypothetical protein